MRKIILILLVVLTTASCGTCSGRKNECSNADATSVTDSDLISEKVLEAQVFTTISTEVEQTFFGSGVGEGGGNAGTVAEFFDKITSNASYKNTISAMFMLYIIFYGLSISMGATDASTKDAVIRVAKIAIIYYLLLSWNNFYASLGSLFVDGTKELMGITFSVISGEVSITGKCATASGLTNYAEAFKVLDCLIAQLFSVKTFDIIKAFLTAGLTGPVILIIFIFILYNIARILFLILVVYLVSLIARGLLFVLAPIFIAFLLFERTRDMTFVWLKLVFNFSLQPVVISIAVGIFLVIISPFINYLAVIGVCYDKIIKIFCLTFFDLDGVNGLQSPNVYGQTEGVSGFIFSKGSNPFPFVMLVFYYLTSVIFLNFTRDIVSLAAYLTGSRTVGGIRMNTSGGVMASFKK